MAVATGECEPVSKWNGMSSSVSRRVKLASMFLLEDTDRQRKPGEKSKEGLTAKVLSKEKRIWQ